MKTNIFKAFENRDIIVHVHRTGDLRETHTVSDQEDYIPGFSKFNLGKGGWGCSGFPGGRTRAKKQKQTRIQSE